MTFKQWLTYGIYKKLWSVVGQRKWTWIMRDFAYQNPLLVAMLFFGLGMLLRPHVDWDDLWKFLAGLLIAHVLWGAHWIPGQGKRWRDE